MATFQPATSSAGLGVIPISCTPPAQRMMSGWPALAKRSIDISVALLGLALLIVFGPAIALAIVVESPGWPLFRQRRIGLGNESFGMWKFRTMRHHDATSNRLAQATRHDPRITWVGAFLRRTSLDELPQVLNVLRGEMSVIGPRPHAPGTCAGGKPFELVAPQYPARHRVRPGMTGLAQVRGWRGATETEDKLLRRIQADLEYIDNWSLSLDMAILARTIVAVFGMWNAY